MNKPISCWLAGISALLGGALPWTVLADGDTAAGARKAIYCAYCHGSDGNPDTPGVPRLAGQKAKALAAKMRHAPSGQERSHLMYEAFVTGDCLNERGIADLAAYFSAQAAAP